MKLILIGVVALGLLGCGKPHVTEGQKRLDSITPGEWVPCERVSGPIGSQCTKTTDGKMIVYNPLVDKAELSEKECPLIKRMMICNDGFVVIKDTKGGAGIPQSECAKHSGTNDTFVVHTLRMGEHYRLVLAAQGEDISDVELKKELP